MPQSDTALMADAMEKVLTRNSNHVDTLLLLADRSIDAEDYAETDRLLDQIQEVNPWNLRGVGFSRRRRALAPPDPTRSGSPAERPEILDQRSACRSINWA